MNYRNIHDLSKTIRENLFKIPPDVDLIVGIPRSGILSACILALNLNVKFCDFESFLKNDELKSGQTRTTRFPSLKFPSEAQHVLIIDDSIASGESLQIIKEKSWELNWVHRITYCAVYAGPNSTEKVDIFFEIVKYPRVFEWNLMHRPLLEDCCVDIDGVLCVDPLSHQNDDGSVYREFLLNATPLAVPSYPIGHLVTSRLEKYREETIAWLKKK